MALCVAVVLSSHGRAFAGECAQPTPECHLDNGKRLLASDPKRAAAELLASYQLDERTETLALYAGALAADHRYARALEAWQRIILFRESEIEGAKERMRDRKTRARAEGELAIAQRNSEDAAAEIMNLWPHVARVRVAIPDGESWMVTADGVEVDPSKDILVNAGSDELVFTRKDGSSAKVPVAVAAGQVKKIDAPQIATVAMVAMVAPAEAPHGEPAPKVVLTPAPKAPAPRPSVVEHATAEMVEVEDGGPRSPTLARVGIGMGIVGVAGLAMSGTVAYLAHRDFHRAKALGCDGDGQCPVGEAADLGERAHDRTRFAQISAAGGGALLVGGAALWLFGHRHTHHAAQIAVTDNSFSLAWSIQ